MMPTIAQQKQALRTQAKQIRRTAWQQCPQAGQQICQQLLTIEAFKQPTQVSAFWPLAEEIDTLPMLNALHQQGHMLLLPIMQVPIIKGAEKPLLFGQWQPGDKLITAAFNTQEPPPSAKQATPHIMLTPLLAFDRKGYRLGYGGGFYDRTIAKLKQQPQCRLLTIGIALSAQEVDSVVTDVYDLPLDIIVTEKAVISCATS